MCSGSLGGPTLRELKLKGKEAWRERDMAIPLVFVLGELMRCGEERINSHFHHETLIER